jgi:hypothetical protein
MIDDLSGHKSATRELTESVDGIADEGNMRWDYNAA